MTAVIYGATGYIGQLCARRAVAAAGASYAWAQVSTPDGRTATATLAGPEAYEFTARTAVLLLRRALAGDTTPGFQTPATAYGPDLVLEVPGVTRTDR